MSARAVCYRCLRAEMLCTCALRERVPNRTPVIILQHEREQRHPIGTARLAHLALARSELIVAGTHAPTSVKLPAGAALLYPSRQAQPIEDGPPPSALVVLDGTWHQAHALYRVNRWLAELPHVRIVRSEPSGYRIRREPRHECLSTVEAIADALRALEPETAPGLDRMVAAFATMIDRQISHGRPRRPRHKTRRRAQSRAVPEAFERAWQQLVVVYAEHSDMELVYFTAHRPATGETFARRVRSAVTERQLEKMGLPAEPAVEPHELARDWSAFAGADAVVAGWTDAALDLLPVPGAERVFLKPAYCNLHRGPTSHLDAAAARLGLDTPELPVLGRARLRLGAAVAIAGYLRDCALAASPGLV